MSQPSKKVQPTANPSGKQRRMHSGSVPGVGSMGVPTTSTGPHATNLDTLRKIAEAPDVTAGPWFAFDRGIGYEVHHASGYELNNGHRETFTKPDATHIATFDPPTVLALLSRLEQAEAIVNQLTPTHLKMIRRALDGDRA